MDTEHGEVTGYQIKTESYEGPFHLLLSLIAERKFFINDLSLAEVTEDYIRHVNELENKNPADISQFVVVAATLILIKSKSLLPKLDLSPEEESDIKELEDRLKLYELYTKLGLHVKEKFGEKILFSPEARKNDILVFLPDEKITPNQMMVLAQDILGRMPRKEVLPEVEVKKVVSLDEMLSSLRDRITNAFEINFKEFAGSAQTKEEKVTVIISFLAMLELVREGILNAVQDDNFGDIMMSKENTPNDFLAPQPNPPAGENL